MRTFIAVEIGPEARRTLAGLLAGLRSRFSGVRWSKPENVHVTLRFLGEVDDRLIPEVAAAARAAAERSPPFSLELGEPSSFGGRVLHLSVGGEIEAVSRLQAALEDELDERGFGREGRPFAPHLTLGRRGKGEVPGAWKDATVAGERAWDVGELVVFSSELTPGGPIYTALARCPLSGTTGEKSPGEAETMS